MEKFKGTIRTGIYISMIQDISHVSYAIKRKPNTNVQQNICRLNRHAHTMLWKQESIHRVDQDEME